MFEDMKFPLFLQFTLAIIKNTSCENYIIKIKKLFSKKNEIACMVDD